jgi:N-succinyldiaminopimelate aminotransferase
LEGSELQLARHDTICALPLRPAVTFCYAVSIERESSVNPDLDRLHPYPFEKLRALFATIPPATSPLPTPIRLSIGEPQHPTPSFIHTALTDNLAGLAVYPTTAGSDELRATCANWLQARYGLKKVDPATEVLPVNGSREALFAFAQAMIDRSRPRAKVVCPNPFYQIYEGAALLAGAEPVYLDKLPQNGFVTDYSQLSEADWQDVQLLFVCSPDNPTGNVLDLDTWRTLFELSDRHGFVIAADECYSEIYLDETRPPLGALEAAQKLGRTDWRNLVMFTSLSKRSNVPGLRSGFVAGDARLLKAFLRYRTYHGCAMGTAVQAASIAAWRDEAHVRDNRARYRAKFAAVMPILAPWLKFTVPDAGFYLWAQTPESDTDFARGLQATYNVTVLPGSFLARDNHGHNPGASFVRIALVADESECIEAAQRIAAYCAQRVPKR